MTHDSCRKEVIQDASSATEGTILHASDYDTKHGVPTDFVLSLLKELADSGAAWFPYPTAHTATIRRPNYVVKATPGKILAAEKSNSHGTGVKGSETNRGAVRTGKRVPGE